MASANYVLLERITVGAAGASSVTFSNIPQTGYTDLVIKCSVRNTANVDWTGVYFNGVTTGYSNRAIQGTGAAATSRNNTDKDLTLLTDENAFTASTFSNGEVYIPNYTSANYKSYSVDTANENNATTAYMELSAQLWSNTAAITSITLNAQSSSLAQYSTFYLYGVAKLGTTPAIAPYATGGDTIMTDGTYWYHTFISSGTFTPAKALSCDYLVVAGGGGGAGVGNGVNQAYPGGQGGGAGGLRCTVTATGGGGSLESKLSLALNTSYTVTVGAGGVGTLGSINTSTNGSNSVFSTVTSIGGGGTISYVPQSGGSGAGGNSSSGASGTSNQGFAGGNATNATGYGSAGGGGAGAVGVSTSNDNGGAGGAGVTTSISGTSTTYAGGGGGAAYGFNGGSGSSGGTGGGGAGASGNNNGGAGTVNTGGGGGGASQTGTSQKTGGNGGSGIVIVRYAV